MLIPCKTKGNQYIWTGVKFSEFFFYASLLNRGPLKGEKYASCFELFHFKLKRANSFLLDPSLFKHARQKLGTQTVKEVVI